MHTYYGTASYNKVDQEYDEAYINVYVGNHSEIADKIHRIKKEYLTLRGSKSFLDGSDSDKAMKEVLDSMDVVSILFCVSSHTSRLGASAYKSLVHADDVADSVAGGDNKVRSSIMNSYFATDNNAVESISFSWKPLFGISDDDKSMESMMLGKLASEAVKTCHNRNRLLSNKDSCCIKLIVHIAECDAEYGTVHRYDVGEFRYKLCIKARVMMSMHSDKLLLVGCDGVVMNLCDSEPVIISVGCKEYEYIL